MSNSRVSVINLSQSGDDALVEAQQSAAREIAAGRDVVIVCERAVLNREERMLLARPAIARNQGRMAIVHAGFPVSSNVMPAVMLEFVQCFTNMEEAMDWVRPQSFQSTNTILYMNVR